MRLILTRVNPCLWAAAYIKETINIANPSENKPFVLGLPTGGTVLDMYANLRLFQQSKQLSFENVLSFNMDEYAKLPPEHPQSYHTYMKQNLFDATDFKPENTHILNGMAPDLSEECARYEESISNVGGIDLFLGGVGRNGHIAFNEPGSDFNTRTRVVDLTHSTREANCRYFDNDINQVPAQALTVGIGTVLDAKEILFLAVGAGKAEAVQQLVQGPQETRWPVTALRTHPNAIMLVDEGAISKLSGAARTKLYGLKEAQPDAHSWVLDI